MQEYIFLIKISKKLKISTPFCQERHEKGTFLDCLEECQLIISEENMTKCIESFYNAHILWFSYLRLTKVWEEVMTRYTSQLPQLPPWSQPAEWSHHSCGMSGSHCCWVFERVQCYFWLHLDPKVSLALKYYFKI